MIASEDVDRPVEAALELLGEIDDIGGPVGRRAAAVRRAHQHAVVVIPVAGRARPDGAVLLVGVEPRQELRQPLLELALQDPGVEVDPEALERRLDLRQHLGHRVALLARQLRDVLAPVAVLRWLLPAPDRLDRGSE